jgi:hypothetical protein
VIEVSSHEGWTFVETIDATELTFEEAKREFLSRHPDLANVASEDLRVDHMLTARDPTTVAYRFWVRPDDVDSPWSEVDHRFDLRPDGWLPDADIAMK